METLIRFGLRAAIVGLVVYYGSAYVAVGISDGCWNPLGCIRPADVQSYKDFMKAPNAYGGPHS